MRFLVLSVFLLGLGIPKTSAQQFTRYGFNEGLESEYIVDITQDHHGYLWLATLGGGIARFDGEAFSNYTVRKGLSHNFVMDIFCLGDSVYSMTDNGISIYRPGAGFNNISTHAIKSSVVINGNIWFRSSDGNLMLHKGGNTASIPIIYNGTEDSVASIEYIGGVVYVLTSSMKLFKVNETTAEFVHDFSAAPIYQQGAAQITIGQGPDYNKDILIDRSVNEKTGINFSTVRQILRDGSRLWVIQDKKLFKYDGAKSIDFTKYNEFTEREVNVLFKDRENNIWVGTNDGLFKYEEPELTSLLNLAEDDEVKTVVPKGASFLVGTALGEIYDVSGTNVALSPMTKFTRDISISTLCYDNATSTLWVGSSDSGLFSIDEKQMRLTSYEGKVSAKTIRKLSLMNKRLMIGTEKGLYVRNEDGSFNSFNTDHGLSDNVIWGLAQDDTSSFLVLTRQGLDVLRYRSGITHDTTYNSVFERRITCFEKDGYGNLWIGTVGYGLIYIDRYAKTMQFITTDDGLNSDVITNLAWNNGRSILVGTNRGIDMITINKGDHDVPEIRRLTRRTLATNFNTFYLDSKSETLWVGNISRLVPLSLKPSANQVAPILMLEENKYLDGNKVKFAADGLSLKYDENNVDFSFKAVSLTDPDAITYSYRLMGWDSTWSFSKASSTLYTNLPPGKYKFQVRAVNQYQQSRSEILSSNFTILKPLWEEVWFIAGSIVILAVIVYSFYMIRLRSKINRIFFIERKKQEEVEKVRQEMARDFHDSIGNKLAGIKLYSNLALMKSGEMGKDVTEMLQFIEVNSQELFEGTKDFIWSIDPESDNLVEVFTYVRDFGEELFRKSSITFYSNLDDHGFNPKLKSGFSRHIVLIFREAMTNTIKHSGANTVKLNLNITDTEFSFTYMDSGKGMDPHGRQGKGINNMLVRAGYIGAKLTFRNLDAGTEIDLHGHHQSKELI